MVLIVQKVLILVLICTSIEGKEVIIEINEKHAIWEIHMWEKTLRN
jgi:hypothetical protein